MSKSNPHNSTSWQVFLEIGKTKNPEAIEHARGLMACLSPKELRAIDAAVAATRYPPDSIVWNKSALIEDLPEDFRFLDPMAAKVLFVLCRICKVSNLVQVPDVVLADYS